MTQPAGCSCPCTAALFWAASYLTTPICKTRESFYLIQVTDLLYPNTAKASRIARKIALFLGIIGWAILAIPTAALGVILRFAATCLQRRKHFIRYRGIEGGSSLPKDRKLTILSWNICARPAGYSLTTGGVTPWKDRIDAIVRKIKDLNPSVVCLYEVFDPLCGFYLRKKLSESGYGDIHFHMGPKSIGLSSGMFFASKYRVKYFTFTEFPRDTLVGRTKFIGKGFFIADLVHAEDQTCFSTVCATDLQDSESVSDPEPEELTSRMEQLSLVMEKINRIRERVVVLSGNFNCERREVARIQELAQQTGECDLIETTSKKILDTPSRTGNRFCTTLMGKKESEPANLDYVFILSHKQDKIETAFVETGFNSEKFLPDALSNRLGLLSTITVA